MDRRLYLAHAEWLPRLNRNDHALLCHQASPDDNAYHRISVGEIFLAQEDVAYCLNCALVRGLATIERPQLARRSTFLDETVEE